MEMSLLLLRPVHPRKNLALKKNNNSNNGSVSEVYDASAKLPSGIFRGNANQLGDFDQCLSINADDTTNIQGKYCVAFMDVKAVAINKIGKNSLQEALAHIEYNGFLRSTNKIVSPLAPHLTTINWGVCVPATCSSVDVQEALLDELQVYNQTHGISFDVIVMPDICYVKSDTERTLSASAIGTLILFGCFFCIAIIATIMDRFSESNILNKQGTLSKVIMAFSIFKNIDKLTDNTPADDIACLHGIRFTSMLLVYTFHRAGVLYHEPFVNKVEIVKLCRMRWAFLLTMPLIPTNSFLILSAVLASYHLSKKMCHKKKVNWMKYYISRFMRLTPAYLAVILLHSFLLEYLGDGPFWNKMMKDEANNCKKNFLWYILYLNNLIPSLDTCALHTYSLALEMQLSLLLPVLVTLLWNWQIVGVTVSLFLFAMSTLLRYQTAYENHLSITVSYNGMLFQDFIKFCDIMYRRAEYRVGSYVMRVVLGYLLYKNGKSVSISKSLTGIGWVISTCLLYFISIYPAYMLQSDYKYDVKENSLYAACLPALWSLVLGWIIWTCYTGNAGFINRFLSSRIFKIGSRISYSFYLIQAAVMYWSMGVLRYPVHFSVIEFLFDLPMTTVVVIAAVILTLLFDLPFQEIKKILLNDDKSLGITHTNILGNGNQDMTIKNGTQDMTVKNGNQDMAIKNGKDKIH